MSEYCEIVEELVLATSECPATDVIMVEGASASGTSVASPGMTPPLQVGSANATAQVTIDAYAMMTGLAQASSEVSQLLVVTDLIVGAGQGASTITAFFNQLAASVANAEDEIAAADIPYMLLSAAQAASSVQADTVAVLNLDSSATAKSTVSLGLLESVASSADTSSMVVLLRRVEQLVATNAAGEDEAYPSAVPRSYLLLSTGNAASLTLVQTNRTLLIESVAEASGGVWYKDTGRVAWLMNTETTAASWYDNFDFESIAQTPGKVLAVGPDGLYELVGATDEGDQIDAEVVSGFGDFGTPNTKRVDLMYFGYTSEGQISVTPETYESGHSPATYFLEQREANAPRNSRVQPGKALYGRYWRMTIRNVDGADFEVHDATVDIAVSSRKV